MKAILCSILLMVVFGFTNAMAQDELPDYCYNNGVLIPDNPDPNCAADPDMPLDSGLVFLIAAGAIYATVRMRKDKTPALI